MSQQIRGVLADDCVAVREALRMLEEQADLTARLNSFREKCGLAASTGVSCRRQVKGQALQGLRQQAANPHVSDRRHS